MHGIEMYWMHFDDLQNMNALRMRLGDCSVPVLFAAQEFDLTAANDRFEKLDNPDTGAEWAD